MTPEEVAEIARQRRLARRSGQPPEVGKGSVADPLLQGVSMGFADEIGGAVAGAGAMMRGEEFGPAYAQQRDQMRNDYEAYKSRRPLTSMALEVAGAIPTALVPFAGPARALNVARSTTAPGVVARGAGAGGVTGAAYGYGQGEGGALSRGGNAVANAVTGAAVGAAIPAAGIGAGRLIQGAANRIRPNAATKAGIPLSTQRFVRRTLADEDATLGGIQQTTRAFGPYATPMDASPGLRNEGEGLLTYNRPGSDQIRQTIERRRRQANKIVAQGFDETMGPRPDASRLTSRLQEQIRARGNANYAAAEAKNAGRPIDTTPVLDQLMQLIEVETGTPAFMPNGPGMAPTPLLRELQTIGRNLSARTADGAVSQVTDYNKVTGEQRRLNALLRDLSSSASGAERNMARQLQPVHDLLVRQIDQTTDGAYSAAIRAYRGDNAAREAFEQGQKDVGGPIDPSFVRDRLAEMSAEERMAYRDGARVAMNAMFSRVRGGTQTRNAVLTEGTAVGEKLRLIFGDDAFDQMMARMQGAEEMAVTDRTVSQTGQSATARRQASRHNPDRRKIPLDTGVVGGSMRLGQEGLNWLVNNARSNDADRAMSRLLASQGSERDRLIAALIASQRPPLLSDRNRRLALHLAGSPGRAAAGPSDPSRVPNIVVRPSR